MRYFEGVRVLAFEKFKCWEWWLRKRHDIPTATADQCFSQDTSFVYSMWLYF